MEKGVFFEPELLKNVRNEFCMLENDPQSGRRLFFDNSGGSLRLRKAVEAKCALEQFPDCPERDHDRGVMLKGIVKKGTEELRDIVFDARGGSIMTELTASQCMFRIVDTILSSVKGGNAVVSELEHPSAFDSVHFFGEKYGVEVRVAHANKVTGRIDPEEIDRLCDKNTRLVSVMLASNISGSVMDMQGIAAAARAKNPDVYVISDGVQYAPHMAMEAGKLGLDAVNFAPYKFFSVRGCGYAYVSDRVARLPHDKLIAKPYDVFELGTPAPGNFAAMMSVIDYVCSIGARFTADTDRKAQYGEGMWRIHLQERALLQRMLSGLRQMKKVHISADPESVVGRDLIAGIEIEGMSVKAAAEEYQRRGIVTAPRAADSLYSKRIVEALGAMNGLVRVSPMHCHSAEEIDEFLNVTEMMAK